MEVNGVNVVTLHSGTYQLVIDVEDLDNGEKISTNDKFYVYRQGDFEAERLAQYEQHEQCCDIRQVR